MQFWPVQKQQWQCVARTKAYSLEVHLRGLKSQLLDLCARIANRTVPRKTAAVSCLWNCRLSYGSQLFRISSISVFINDYTQEHSFSLDKLTFW